MSEIKIEQPSMEKLKQLGVFSWPIWEKEASCFDWHYDRIEMCYILEGQVTVEEKAGKAVSFGPGNFVTFPKGLDCVWNIKEAVRKHYSFK